MPTSPKILKLVSRSKMLNPYGPMTIPAIIMPTIEGILRGLNTNGPNSMTARTIRKIATGCSIGNEIKGQI